MKIRKFITLTIVPLLIALLLVFQQQTTLQAQKQKGTESRIEKIPFVYDKKDFGKVETIYEKKINSEEQSVKDQFPIDAPAHTCFNLEDKRPLPALEKGARYFSPTYSFICFIPTGDATESDFARAYPNFSKSVEKLRKLLTNRPADFKQYDDLFDVPYNNAGWSFKSKVQYLDYKTVSGVFFLTQYSQELTPNLANNEELTANFQGLTKDGKFYVAARFAVTHSSLPKGIDFTDQKIQEEAWSTRPYEALNEKVGKYLQAEREKVEKLAEDTFQPSVINLKKIIASIEIK